MSRTHNNTQYTVIIIYPRESPPDLVSASRHGEKILKFRRRLAEIYRAKHLLYHYISLVLGNIEIGDFLLTLQKKVIPNYKQTSKGKGKAEKKM